MTHESRYVRVAKLASQLTSQTFPRYWHAHSPHRFTVLQPVSCALMMFYLDLSYRDMEDWLLATDQVRQALGLQDVPDHTTLYRTYRRMRLPHLDSLRQALLADLKPEEESLAADATCYQLTNASEYFLTRRGHPRREWRKGVYAVGTHSQLILGWRQSSRPGNDALFLNGLCREARRYGRSVKHQRAWTLLADTGVDGRGVQANGVIPPMRRHGKITDPERRAQADQVSAARLEGLFGQRWKTETVHSVIKQKGLPKGLP